MDLTIAEQSAAMHAAVSHRLHNDSLAFTEADDTITGVGQATRYAPDNQWLRANAWVSQTVLDAARADDGIYGLPVDGGAVIVRACAYSTEDGDGSWHRHAEPLRPDGGPLNQSWVGICDRCDLTQTTARALGLIVVQKPVITFHISCGRFVVEFAVCDECAHDLQANVGPIFQAVRRAV